MCPETIAAVISISLRTLTLCDSGRTFQVGVGKAGWETPLGRHVVLEKHEAPLWTHPVTGHVTRAEWFKNVVVLAETPRGVIAIHSYPQLGSSHGCIRMLDSDSRIVYDSLEVNDTVLVKY